MIFRKYGATNKKISVLGLGGSRFKCKSHKDIDYSVRLIRKASELGINFFDTAPMYCNKKSETIFGEAFKKMPNKFYVSTKSRVLQDSTADAVRRRIDISLAKLGINKIHFYDMWAVSSRKEYESIIKKGGPLDGAVKAKQEGLVDHITFSSRLPDKDIIKIIRDGYFEGVTLSYNLINYPASENAIEEAHRAGLGVAIMTPLAGGIIAKHQSFFSFFKKNKKESIAQAALRFVISTPGVATVIFGTSSEENLVENATACVETNIYSSTKLKNTKNKIKKQLFLLCDSCNKCIASCPRNIHVPMYMDIYNLKLIQNNKTAVRDRLIERKNRPLYSSTNPARFCDSCQKCEKLCPKHLDIAKRMNYFVNNIEKRNG